MKMHPTYKIWVVAFASAWLTVQNSFAGIQASENFDTNWPGAPFPNYNSWSNTVNPVSSWAISSNSIFASFANATTPSNICYFAAGGRAAITSPMLTNGIGAISYDAKCSGTAGAILSLESSFNGSTWFTNSIVTNINTTTSNFTYSANSFSNQYSSQYFRMRRIDAGVTTYWIDTLRINYPAPVVTVSNLNITPVRPTDQDPVTISASVGIQSRPDAFAMTNYWRVWPATNWTLAAMTSNNPTLYTSTIPSNSIGSVIECFARASFIGDNNTNISDSASTNYMVVPKSSYTNMAVTGALNFSLTNGASHQWQGVIQVTNLNPTFNFQGISNAVTNIWGELNQSVSNIPLYGQTESTTNRITLYTTNTGYYLFSFNETNLVENYSVRACTYENFNTWTNLSTSTNTPNTNSTGWVLFNGNTSNDATRTFSNTGRSALIETNGWLQTPYLTNGVGQVCFWYRNWSTTGAPTGSFIVQSSDSNAANWVTLSTVSNIVSTNYLFFSLSANDIASRYVRILNTNTTTRTCLDEVVVAQPGAVVTGISTTPTNAPLLASITIAYTLTSYNGAVISNVTAWYRVGTNGQWETGNMTATDGVNYVLSPPLTGLPPGTNSLQHAVQCSYSGFSAGTMPVFLAGGTNNPAGVIVSSADNRQENFDTNWPGAPFPAFNSWSNTVNPVSSWAISSNSIFASFANATTPSNICYFAAGGRAAITSPMLTNGIGAISYDARCSATAGAILSLESSFNGSTWFTNSIVTNINTTTSNFIYSVNSPSNQYFRMRRIDSGTTIYWIDTLRITYPPANVLVTNVNINPGYPVAGQAFTASCDVVSLNSIFPAYNISPQLYYWTSGALNSNTMTRAWTSGTTNHYTLIQTLSNVTRDTYLNYYVRADFDGYYGSLPEKKSPRFSITNSILVRASASAFQTIGVTVNDSLTTGRLLTNRLWQTVFTTSSTNMLTFSFAGSGFSAGTGYATNTMVWGNTNAGWQTTFPLADVSSTGQTAFTISGASNEFSGQYVMRFDETTGQYIILRCVSQDFDNWTSNDDLYKLEANGSTPTIKDSFDTWTTNRTQTRIEPFSDPRWTAISFYTNYAAAGPAGYGIFVGRIASGGMVTTNPPLKGRSFIAQGCQLKTEAEPEAMKGVGRVSFTYKCTTATNNSIGVYLYTNVFLDPLDYTVEARWITVTNSTVSNTAANTYTVTLNTNASADIIISHDTGNSTVTFDDISVSEWYADAQTNGGWYTSESWVEPSAKVGGGNTLRFDTSRADKGVEQFVVTPMLTNGINTVSFDYCSASTDPVSFTLSTRTNIYDSWVVKVSTNISGFNGSASDYRTYNWLNITAATNTYLKITHTTNSPGILLIDNVKITGASVGATWEINNVAIDDTDQPVPPLTLGVRQYYDGFCSLNSNRTSNLASSTLYPYTNTWPYIISPILSAGIGEISFRYRNWTTSGAVTPARLLIQTTTNTVATTNDAIWTTVNILDNIVNTNDYQYYQYIVNNSTSRYVRIYNDDQYTSKVGRVCLDDILIAEPLASTLSLSNLVITPSIPLYSNTVQIAADIYKLFLAPTNITLTAYYATATTYAALSAATPIPLAMSCIASNPTTPGQWYRYQTTASIPTNAIDTFVKYYVQASYGGYQAASTSPRALSSFTTYPAWYAPMDQVYTNGIAYYVVYSCPTGSVWINEINAIDFSGSTTIFTNEFIEISGKSGIDLKNWKLDVYQDWEIISEATYITTYTLTNATVLSNQSNGYGFWVLGTTNIPTINQRLTVDIDEGYAEYGPIVGVQRLPFAGGLSLKRPWGATEQSIAFNTTLPGFAYAGSDGDTYPIGSLRLGGTGTEYSSFTWGESASITPGALNNSQTFPLSTPTITIYGFWINTNVWIECSLASGWQSTPFYSTNLLNPAGWMNAPVLQKTTTPTSDVIRMNFPTNGSTYFYKIVSTNNP